MHYLGDVKGPKKERSRDGEMNDGERGKFRYALCVFAVREPAVFFEEDAGCIVASCRRPSVVHTFRDLPALKHLIFRVPREKDEGLPRYSRENRKDGLNLSPFQRGEYIVDAPISGEVFKGLQGRWA